MTETRAQALARPTGRRLRFWLIGGAIVALGALVIALISATGSSSAAALDPRSPAQGGSKALAQLLAHRGTTVSALTSPSAAAGHPAGTTVVVIDPGALGSDQRQALRSHRVVLLDPSPAALADFTSDVSVDDVAPTTSVAPGCSWAGAQAAGAITFPDPTITYSGPSTCYGGATVVTDQLVVLGSADLLRNDQLAHNNIAALDINAISADGTVTDVAWLLPGIEDTGTGAATVWDLFPPWAQRAFWWLLVVGVVVALWRGRRLGPVVAEPLPVIVRSAEVVEGHGRLYRRADARDRAAALLRAATTARLARRLGLSRQADATAVSELLSASNGSGAGAVLVGAAPADDESLLRLAEELDVLEAGTVSCYE